MRKQPGYTILELMITVAIGAILTAIALPSYRNMIRNNCMTTNVNSLVSSLQQARAEAIKRKTNVTVTAVNAADATNEWGSGWTVTIDEDRNGNAALDPGEDYDGDNVLDAAAEVRTVSLTCPLTTMDETAGVTVFVYGRDGFIDGKGDFQVCDERTGERGRLLTISLTGRPNLNSDFICP